MKMNLYVVYDRVAEEAAPPFAAKNDQVAVRMIRAMLSNEGIPVDQHNEYDLVRIAEYNTSDYQICLVSPEVIYYTGIGGID